MGITIESYPIKRKHVLQRKMRRHKLTYISYTSKKFKYSNKINKYTISQKFQIEMKDMFENELYELVSQMAHVRTYVKNMKFEYCGETAEEMEIYWLMIDDLHHRAIKHYHEAVKDERDLRFDHVDSYKKEYDTFMDEANLTYNDVYEYLFDFPDDGGYQTPPKKFTTIAKIKKTYDELEEITMGINNM